MKNAPDILWFRIDLRLADNPALAAALQRRGPVVPVFIYAPEEEEPWPPGAASKWWLHQSLQALEADLRKIRSRLILRRGPALPALQALIKETGAHAVFWNRRYEPAMIARDKILEEQLRDAGLVVSHFNGALLHEPAAIRNQSGKPFQVFSAFWRHCLALQIPTRPLPRPRHIPAPHRWPKSMSLAEFALEPKINWTDGIRRSWKPGETGAHSLLRKFLKATFIDYSHARNLPGQLGTSRLSPHLHFGEITPRQVCDAIRRRAELRGLQPRSWRNSQFFTEMGWREFAHHLLFHFPHTATQPLRPEFNQFRWHTDKSLLRAWRQGRTGYPFVDAGMRELWTTGWMHNRVRMVVASFLVKDLMISWLEGALWFWDTLVDADLAQNTLGWQWTAGCGADAAPFFRIFNPIAQGEKFDPQGDYVRRWCPEIARLPNHWLHKPWLAPAAILSAAGVELGRTYPHPVISHFTAREVALETFAKIKRKSGKTSPS